MCVVSAVLATLVIVTAVIVEIVVYNVHPEWLNLPWLGNDAIKGEF
jgi:palmitoyltransferase